MADAPYHVTTGMIAHAWQMIPIQVEVRQVFGQPKLHFIGLASQVVTEAKERITAALVSCGVRIKARKIVVNLAPAAIKKTSSALDLAIAGALIEILTPIRVPKRCILLGELALDGSLKACESLWPAIISAKKLGYQMVFFPAVNQTEVFTLAGIDLYPIHSLQELLFFLQGVTLLKPLKRHGGLPAFASRNLYFSIQGQAQAKQAVLFLAAGGHHLLLLGPPGMGKTLLAQAAYELLPPFSVEEIEDTLAVLPGQIRESVWYRPWRAPQASITKEQLLGGGRIWQPGELVMARYGILFCDELGEWAVEKLNWLRQPLEQQQLTVFSGQKNEKVSLHFSFIAASNLCPCGYWGTQKKCHCSAVERWRYRRRLNGPLFDRMDLQVQVEESVASGASPFFSSQELDQQRQQVQAQLQIAWQRQQLRCKRWQLPFWRNVEIPRDWLKKICSLDVKTEVFFRKICHQQQWSVRTQDKMLRIARTCADLANRDQILPADIAQARSFHLVWPEET